MKKTMSKIKLIPLFLSILGCSSSSPIEVAEIIQLKHRIIDLEPNAGADCCLDVCALGDINGDGFLDIVIGSEKAENEGLVWYKYPNWEKHGVAKGQFTTDGKIADIDGDGDEDIIVSDFEKGVGWYENSGGLNNIFDKYHIINPNYAHDIEVGDLNNDGKLDVVTCSKKDVIGWRQIDSDHWEEMPLVVRDGEGIVLADIDNDKDLDVVFSYFWLENILQQGSSNWSLHTVTSDWPTDVRCDVGDINNDGELDIVLTASEGSGKIAWFENKKNNEGLKWEMHVIDTDLEGVHSLKIADFDLDGDLDVLAAEMHTSKQKRIILYFQEEKGWFYQTIGKSGSHNMQVGDFDNDGDIDIVGKNYSGQGKKIELWENLSANVLSLDKWQYLPIDRNRPASQDGKMGLLFVDVNKDGYKDIIAGSIYYENPLGRIDENWRREEISENFDAHFAVDIDSDNSTDIVGIANDVLIWAETSDKHGKPWKIYAIDSVPPGRSQGYAIGQIISGHKPELVFTRGQNLFYLSILDSRSAINGTKFDLIQISNENEEEGVALGDIDRDGDIDIAAYDKDGHHPIWFENPNQAEINWPKHYVGQSNEWLDRIALADINNDGRVDFICTEEKRDLKYNCGLYWFEAPEDPKLGSWRRHLIVTLRSINSLDIADMDNDGDIDIIIAEHTDQGDMGAKDNLTAIYENENNGNHWSKHVIEIGPNSSHLGARVCDLDNDGDLDVISLGWQQYKNLHVWRNLALAN